MNKKQDKKYFNLLAERLEELFEKGEKCKCGKRLPCRSKALALNAWANIYHTDRIKETRQEILKIVIEDVPHQYQERLINFLTKKGE